VNLYAEIAAFLSLPLSITALIAVFRHEHT
jgi:hypothetical protein